MFYWLRNVRYDFDTIWCINLVQPTSRMRRGRVMSKRRERKDEELIHEGKAEAL